MTERAEHARLEALLQFMPKELGKYAWDVACSLDRDTADRIGKTDLPRYTMVYAYPEDAREELQLGQKVTRTRDGKQLLVIHKLDLGWGSYLIEFEAIGE